VPEKRYRCRRGRIGYRLLPTAYCLLLVACPRPKPVEPETGGGGATAREAKPQTSEAPAYLLSALSDAGREEYREILTAEVSPCEAPETLLACAEARRCGECVYLSRVAFRLVRDEASSKEQIASFMTRLKKTRQQNAGKSAPLELSGAPARGPEGAAVAMVEFADFQCGHCALLHAELKRLMPELDRVARFSFKNFPLPVHPAAEPAARAALAAGKQGKFWEYHDLLFERQAEISPERFSAWAKELGLDVARFEADLASEAISAQVARDKAEAEALGLPGTPILILDGLPYLDRLDAEAISDAVIYQLSQKGAAKPPTPPQ
jgi:protein-disulfide isomerase